VQFGKFLGIFSNFGGKFNEIVKKIFFGKNFKILNYKKKI
jgi:hypothetical protein